jgi:hypothetical protein
MVSFCMVLEIAFIFNPFYFIKFFFKMVCALLSALGLVELGC